MFLRRPRVAIVCAAAELASAFGGCGGGSDTTASPPASQDRARESACTPSANLAISADNIMFDRDCLAAPADQPFVIRFRNKEQVAHNIAILASHDAPTTLFEGKTFNGPATMTYHVGPLAAGAYHFHCSIHPDQMNGKLVVQ